MFTLKETASLFASLYKNWDDSVYKDWIRKFSLNEKQKIQELSRGMKVKFSLALAMSHHAEFLIMDEPSSGLDLLTRAQILESLREYMEREGKVPKASFGGRMIPRYLLHYDFVLIRDFLAEPGAGLCERAAR